MAMTAALRAREDKNPVRELCKRSPDFLAVDDPLRAVRAVLDPCTCAYIREIRASAGLAITLAPYLLTTCNRRQQTLLLFGRPKSKQGRAHQLNTEVADTIRSSSARVFFGEDHLLGQRRVTSAKEFRPTNTTPARASERLLPFLAALRQVGMSVHAAQIGKGAGKLMFEPRCCVGSKALLFYCESELHTEPSERWSCASSEPHEPGKLLALPGGTAEE